MQWLSAFHRDLYRLTNGHIGHRLVKNDMLLLTTTGRTTGAVHTVPLLYLSDGDDFIVIASYGGRPQHPDWYRNLVVEPNASAQVLTKIVDVHGITLTHGERIAWWPRIVDAYADYALYQSRTQREIPVVRLGRK